MSVIGEIARTIHGIRRAVDCDVERLCFEVSKSEWDELVDELCRYGGDRPAGGSMKVMGITVRKRPDSESGDA